MRKSLTESQSIKKEKTAAIIYIKKILIIAKKIREKEKPFDCNAKLRVSIAGDIEDFTRNIIPNKKEAPSIATAILFFCSSCNSLISLVTREKTLKLIKKINAALVKERNNSIIPCNNI